MEALFTKIEEKKEAARAWFVSFAHKPHADGWLAFFSFLEASMFPLPPDILQIALTLARPRRWAWYALVVAFFSVIGGAAGYLIGAVFFNLIGEPVISFYDLGAAMQRVGNAFENYTFITVFIAAFTPMPFKVFTIAAGFFEVNIWGFLLASLAGRGLRFFGVGFLSYRYGETLRYIIYRYFNTISLAIAALIILWFFVW